MQGALYYTVLECGLIYCPYTKYVQLFIKNNQEKHIAEYIYLF